ncbi:hypothetical protein IWQ60_003123 [Tieghemiomyces parasiticus]|uniref:Nucleoporin Nup133/Nup155-like N-terminal domain-containing protein n=1 Tax=Tieghemiomyces parasiticus TaxID=78921 RepID=A0A9W8AA71_9FUNG|nr:hypothetical protein IWQ60_003123 [Tieghemiomyces parasiticus]
MDIDQVPPTAGPGTSYASASADPNAMVAKDLVIQAAKEIEKQAEADLKYPDTDIALQASTSGDYTPPLFPGWELFQKTRSIPLPDDLFDQYDLLHCRCFMGLFPEINRAWITIDHRLFLWNYTDGKEFHSYSEQDQIIVSVALVRPKPGVLDDNVNFLLVFATPLEVIMLGIAARNGKSKPGGEVTFYTTQLAVATDNVTMQHIAGTADGRIFMSGSDHHIYEVLYDREEGWFSRRCRKVNLTAPALSYLMPSFLRDTTDDSVTQLLVDDTRRLVFTLSRKSHIEAFYLGPQGTEFHRVARNDQICNQLLALCPSASYVHRDQFVIVALHAVPAYESKRFHLMASTSTGYRLYFSTTPREHRFAAVGYGGAPADRTANAPPSTLELVHVRVPPQSTLTTGDTRSMANPHLDVHCAFAGRGIYLGASGLGDATDTLLTLGSDSGRMQRFATNQKRPTLIEFNTAVGIEGKTWVMTELVPLRHFMTAFTRPTENELLLQTQFPARRFLVLTNSGIHILTHQRPIDYLYQLLRSVTTTPQNFTTFLTHYGATEVCAMCLHLLCTNMGSGDGAGDTLAARQDAVGGATNLTGFDRLTGSAVHEKARNVFFDLAGTHHPTANAAARNFSTGADATTQASFSPRYHGLALYLHRLIAPLWFRPVFKTVAAPSGPAQVDLAYPPAVLQHVQRGLGQLQAFVAQIPPFPDSAALDAAAEAQESERQATTALHALLVYCLEAVAFLLLLHDFRVPAVVAQVPREQREDLVKLQFRDLMLKQETRDLCREVVVAILTVHAGGPGTNAVVDALRKRCAHFCNPDDITLYQALETLMRAKESSEVPERTSLLRESLTLFTRIAPHLSLATLDDVCETFCGLGFPVGAVELALACARAADPDNIALPFYNHDPNCSPQAADVLAHRRECYQRVFTILETFGAGAGSDTSQLMGRPALPGPPRAAGQQARYGNPEEARRLVTHLLPTVKDELFFYCLYEWQLARGDGPELLDAKTPYLEAFLLREPVDQQKCDLLWKYYARGDNYVAAAKVLNNLAESAQFPLNLAERLEYLSLAVGNCRSALNGAARRLAYTLLQDLEEKLEVAQIQLEIQRRLAVREAQYTAAGDHATEDQQQQQDVLRQALELLDQSLLDISTLYNDFAEPFQLYDMMLLIFKSSNHYDPPLVEQLWDAIFQEALDQATSGNGGGTSPAAIDASASNGLFGSNASMLDSGSAALTAVSAKIRELGHILNVADMVFPLPYICGRLETLAYERSSVVLAGWSVQTLASARVPYSATFEALNLFVQHRPDPWKSPEALTFLIRDIVYLLHQWLQAVVRDERTTSGGAGGAGGLLGGMGGSGQEDAESFPVNLVDQAITKYIILLTTIDNPTLLADLQDIQRRIHKLF